jgi:hypothetical protein
MAAKGVVKSHIGIFVYKKRHALPWVCLNEPPIASGIADLHDSKHDSNRHNGSPRQLGRFCGAFDCFTDGKAHRISTPLLPN